MAGDDNRGMGFNPFRPQHRTSADYLFVIAGVVLSVLLVLWAAGVV